MKINDYKNLYRRFNIITEEKKTLFIVTSAMASDVFSLPEVASFLKENPTNLLLYCEDRNWNSSKKSNAPTSKEIQDYFSNLRYRESIFYKCFGDFQNSENITKRIDTLLKEISESDIYSEKSMEMGHKI